MAEDQTYIVKRSDIAEIIRLQDATALEEFLDQPFTAIAEAITGAFVRGVPGLVATDGRIVQGALKGNLFRQFSRELQGLRDAGKITSDFAEKKYGFQTWVELMGIIDSDIPDEDRLEALKAMFFAVNKVNSSDGEKILGYQLFQIAKRLNSGNLLVLKTCYELYKNSDFERRGAVNARQWCEKVARKVGHGLVALVENHERVLVEEGLLGARIHATQLEVIEDNARLTDLGLHFCRNLETYATENQKFSDAEETE